MAKPEKNRNRSQGKKKKSKKDYVFIRKDVVGEVPLYDLDFINKLRVVKDYLDRVTGRAAKKEEIRQAKISDRLSTLEVTCYGFISNTVAPRITKETKRVGMQIDGKFESVTNSLITKSSVHNIRLDVLDVNPNYEKYCKNIPMVATVEKLTLDEI